MDPSGSTVREITRSSAFRCMFRMCSSCNSSALPLLTLPQLLLVLLLDVVVEVAVVIKVAAVAQAVLSCRDTSVAVAVQVAVIAYIVK